MKHTVKITSTTVTELSNALSSFVNSEHFDGIPIPTLQINTFIVNWLLDNCNLESNKE